MQIGGKEISEIIITDAGGGLLATISDEDVIYCDDCSVELKGEENGQAAIQRIFSRYP